MRRSFSLLAIGALTALAVGSAASLIVEGGAIQAGGDLSLSCDNDGVAVDGWGLETDTGLVNSVRIVGIDDACQGNTLFVEITDDGVQIAQGNVGPLVAAHTGGGQVSVPVAPAALAVDITDIHLFIEGPGALPNP